MGAAITCGTAVLMSAWWIAEPVPLWATALLPILIFPSSGVTPTIETLLAYVDPVNFLFLGGMWIASAMEESNLHQRIALGIVDWIGATPRRVVLGFMVATAFISLWISNTATAVMMFPIAMAVTKKWDGIEGDPAVARRFSAALLLGVAYAASIGGIGTKIGTGPNLILVRQAREFAGRDVTFAQWLFIGFPIVVIAIPIVWWYLVTVASPLPKDGVAKGLSIGEERKRLGRMSTGERTALTAFLSAAILWIFRKPMDFGRFVIPGWEGVVPFGWSDLLGRPIASLPPPFPSMLADTGDAVVAVAIGLILLCFPVSLRPLQTALPVRRAVRVQWGVLILLGGAFALAHAMQKSGLSLLLSGALSQVEGLTLFTAVLLVSAATTTVSEVASNTATASIFIPVVASMGAALGLSPEPLMFAAAIAASFGFMLPAGTPPNAIAYSSGYFTVPQMVRVGIVVDLAGILLVSLASLLLVPWALAL